MGLCQQIDKRQIGHHTCEHIPQKVNLIPDMAVATLTALLTDILLDNASKPTGQGNSNSEFVENVLQRQGSNCASNGHNGTLGPTTPTNPNQYTGSYWSVTQNLTSLHLHVWLRGMYPLRSKALGGLSIYVGDGTNTGLWFISGSDVGYSGDWLHAVVDCSRAFDVSSGAPNLASITEIGGTYNISATKGADILYPFFFDAVRKENGAGQNGIRIVGGLTGDRLLISDIPIGDQTLRTGIAEISRGKVFCGGEWHFGNAASTMYLQDSSVSVTLSDLPVAADYYKILFNAGTTGITDFRVSSLSWLGVSRALPFDYDTSALGVGDTHDCPDEVFAFGGVITFGPQTVKLRPTFIECTTVTPNGITLTTPSFANCDIVNLVAANDKILGGSTNLHNTLASAPFITTDDLSKVENHKFDNTAGTGHAIEITAIGTYTFIGNTFTGYGANQSNAAAILNSSGGLVTINVTGGGGTPTFTDGAGASTVVNNAAILSVTVRDDIDSTLIQGAAVTILASAVGLLPFEDAISVTRTGSIANVTHTGHGLVTGQKVAIKGAVQNEYNRIKTITITGTNTYTYPVIGLPATPATGTILATAIIIDGVTDAAGNIQDSRNYNADQGFTGTVQKGTRLPIYKARPVAGTVSSATGATLNVLLTKD